MIGVISLWIAIHQQKIAQENRNKDAALATLLLDYGSLLRDL
jgi:hypothetical protein